MHLSSLAPLAATFIFIFISYRYTSSKPLLRHALSLGPQLSDDLRMIEMRMIEMRRVLNEIEAAGL